MNNDVSRVSFSSPLHRVFFFALPVNFFQFYFRLIFIFQLCLFVCYRNLIVQSVLSVFTTLASANADSFGFDGNFGNECALLLDGPGRTSSFDFNTNTIRGGPQ